MCAVRDGAFPSTVRCTLRAREDPAGSQLLRLINQLDPPLASFGPVIGKRCSALELSLVGTNPIPGGRYTHHLLFLC